ncbi:MAG: hypothetical protein ACRC0X_04960 [Brevinema sp.]
MKLSLTTILLTLFLGACTLQPASSIPEATDFSTLENQALRKEYVTTLNNAKLGYTSLDNKLEDSEYSSTEEFTPLTPIPKDGSLTVSGQEAVLHSLKKAGDDYQAIYRIRNTYAGFAYAKIDPTYFVLVQVTSFSLGLDSNWTDKIQDNYLYPYAWPEAYTPK